MALKRVLSYVKQIASPGLMHDTGCSGLVHWDDPDGWYREGGGGGGRVQDGEHMYTRGGFNTCTPLVDVWQNQYDIVK